MRILIYIATNPDFTCNTCNTTKTEGGATMEYYFSCIRKAVSELLEKGWKIQSIDRNKITATIMEDNDYDYENR